MHHDDRSDTCAPVFDELEACVGQNFLELGRPILELDRFQKPRWRVAVGVEAVVLHGSQRALSRMKDRTPAIKQNAFFGGPCRSLGNEIAEQLFFVLADQLRKDAFDVMADRNRQRQALRIERLCRARYVDNAEHLTIAGVVNWNGRTGPTLDLGAKMLCAMNLNRS